MSEKIIQRKAVIRNARSFYNCCAYQLKSSISYFFIDSKFINEEISNGIGDVFSNAPDLKGIKKAHHLSVVNGMILMKECSNSTVTMNEPAESPSVCDSSPNVIAVNDCVKVISGPYLGYYAIVVGSIGKEWRIQYFKKSIDKFVLKEGDFDLRNI